MRDFKLRLHIIWALICNRYTKSTRYKCWWIWSGKECDKDIMITFDRESFHDRSEDMRRKIKARKISEKPND